MRESWCQTTWRRGQYSANWKQEKNGRKIRPCPRNINRTNGALLAHTVALLHFNTVIYICALLQLQKRSSIHIHLPVGFELRQTRSKRVQHVLPNTCKLEKRLFKQFGRRFA